MRSETVVEIGCAPVLLRSQDSELQEYIGAKYAHFITDAPSSSPFDLTVDVDRPASLNIECREDRWSFGRQDFRTEWSLKTRRGRVWLAGQTLDSIDSVLRILLSILIVPQGGSLFHSASAIRDGKAFLFPGVSTAGKSTISSLAPPDVTVLTDEISYVRPLGDGYQAFGTPFAGSLNIPGESISAPLEAVYLLAKGPENKIDPIARRDAITAVMRNMLFFTKDPQLTEALFETACRIVARVPVYRLAFVPTPKVWEMIR
jgi:hypothetical protein